MAGKVFISYRREDDPAAAARVRDALAARFGKANLFMDVDSLSAGQRFEDELAKALAACDVFIAIIGPRWMDLLKSRGQMSGVRDFVRDEIALALKRKIMVVPVRVGRENSLAPLPRAKDLPSDIRDLVLFQKHDVVHENFARDIAGLAEAITRVRGSSRPKRALPWAWAGAAASIVVSISALVYVLHTIPVKVNWSPSAHALTTGSVPQAEPRPSNPVTVRAQPVPAPAQKGAPAAASAPPAASQSAWVKLCEKANDANQKKEVNVCLTHHERLDGNSGKVLVSAAVRQIDGQDKQHFMVMVPLGMLIQPGMRTSIYPKDQWELVQKNEKIDETKLKGIKLGYTICHPAGCTAEMEATSDLLNDLRTSGGLVVFAINAAGQPVGFPVSLIGFEQAYTGSPVDSKQYGEARQALIQQIAQRQQQLKK
jgi:invasion protein IalB